MTRVASKLNLKHELDMTVAGEVKSLFGGAIEIGLLEMDTSREVRGLDKTRFQLRRIRSLTRGELSLELANSS
jgi:hypothetical protein